MSIANTQSELNQNQTHKENQKKQRKQKQYDIYQRCVCEYIYIKTVLNKHREEEGKGKKTFRKI